MLRSRPSRAFAIVGLALAWGGCSSPSEPQPWHPVTTAYGTAWAQPHGYEFDAGAAARAVDKGYAAVPDSGAVRLDGLRILVVRDVRGAASAYYPHDDHIEIEPGLEALIEGAVIHRIQRRLAR